MACTAAAVALAVITPDAAAAARPGAARPRAVPPAAAALAEPSAATESGALAAAADSGERVEVTGLRSETTQVFAEPDGRLTAESAAVPQRVRRDNGDWAPVDLELKPSPDGTLRPGASVADVRFSGGGDGPLVTLVRGGRTLTLSWPQALPKPSLTGDAATYPNVLTDVDLVVRATDTGFSHVLVVKTPKAATDPKVREVRYRLGGDARVATHPAGGLEAVAGGTVLASAQPATMWDSVTSAPAALQASAPDDFTPEPSTPRAPGDVANVATIATSVDDGHLVLRPDAELLDAAPAAFPLYVDPNWSTGKNKWAYATNNNSNNGDTTRARVGKDPEGSRTYRSFFNFSTAFLNKKHVQSAYVQMEIDHTASCDPTYTHLYHSGAIASTPRTKWSPSLSTWLASAASRAPEGDGCDGKADQVVNFRNAAVTSKMREGAAKSWGNMTFGFCACNDDGEYESSTDRWKKFFPDKAKLIVEYASTPAAPTALRIAGVACPASNTVSIGNPRPALTATYNDADKSSNQTLTATYEFAEVLAGGGTSARTPPGSRSVPAGSTTTSAAMSGLLDGKRYRIRTRATDPAPYNLAGPWSPWCTFTVDTAVPAAPRIEVLTAPTLPGTVATVRLSSNNKDVVSFNYGWDDLPLRKVTATGTTVKTATVSLTAPRYGGLKLYAQATDVTQNNGTNGDVTFTVGRPTEAIARWRLESHPGAPVDTALADGRPTVGGDTPLSWEETVGPDTGWRPDARLLGGSTASFDRTLGGPGGSAAVLVPALDTSKSFSVAAWARVADDTRYQTVVSKEGSAMSVFRLQYRPAEKSWCMTMRARDVAGSNGASACAPPAAFKVGRWTHLAGVYDDTELRVKLFVDGALAVDVAAPAAFVTQWAGGWNATGPLVVGRASDAGFTPRFIDFFHGEIADVQVFDRALVAQDLVGQRSDDEHATDIDEPGIVAPVRVGWWLLDSGFCYSGQDCNTEEATEWKRPLTLTAGTEHGPGVRNNALVLDGTHFALPDDPLHGTATREYGFSRTLVDGLPQDAPVLRTDQPFTVAAWVRLDDAARDQTVVSQDTAGAGFSGFDVSFRAADKKWVFAMRNGAGVTDPAQRSVAAAVADDPTGWHHLVAVSDPGRKQLRLYVDGDRVSAATTHAGLIPWQATGPFVVGRSDQPAGPTDWLHGSLDNVAAYQGVLTDASIRLLHRQEQNETTVE